MWLFIINNAVPSKKNGKQIISIGKSKRIISSKKYLEAVEPIAEQFIKQIDAYFGDEPPRLCGIDIDIFFVCKNKRRWDAHNKAEGLFDIMTKVGLIQDDNRFVINKQSLETCYNPDIDSDLITYISIRKSEPRELPSWVGFNE